MATFRSATRPVRCWRRPSKGPRASITTSSPSTCTPTFQTVAGDIAFGTDGEWAKSRQFFTQFQGVTGNGMDQFRDTTHQVILWPAEYKTGDLIYPYDKAKKKQ